MFNKKDANIKIGVEVDNEKLEKTVDLIDAVNDTKPNITIKYNESVYVTINNFNETAKKYYEEEDK